MTHLYAYGVVAWLMLAGLLPAAGAQVELDRIVSRVGGRIITQSDIRQARTLRLVDDVSSDTAVQRALETRLLILQELARAAPVGPIDAAALADRRQAWEGSIGGGGSGLAALKQAAMSESDLDTWLRDDLRIRAYVARQFGMLPDAERTQAIEEWVARLRQRADLPR
jgi:hypothetical protein